MPRLRGADMPQPQQQQQRQSPRVPLHLRTESSDSNGAYAHRRRISPKPEGNLRRSPRTPLQELPASATNQKKRGTRVSALETKLGHAKEELGKLKEQLASAEAAKKDAQHELRETKKMMPSAEAAAGGEEREEEQRVSTETGGSAELQEQKDDEQKQQPIDAPSPVEYGCIQAAPFEASPEEGGDEIHVRAVMAEGMSEEEEKNEGSKQEETREPSPASPVVMAEGMPEEEKSEGGKEEEPKEPSPATPPAAPESAQVTVSEENKKTDTNIFQERPKLPEKAEVVESCLVENAGLKKQLAEAEAEVAAGLIREAEMALRLSLAGEELAEAKSTADQMREQLKASEAAKASLETEMRTMRVQTEQWRKAAEEAAAVLSGPTAEARVSVVAAGRRGSTEEHMGSGVGFSGLWSPLASVETEEGVGVGGRRIKGGVGGGIRVFGDLWRKRGQQQQQHHQRI